MNKIYTGNGDKGYTKTLSSFRVSKSDAVIELLGCTDEFIAALMMAAADVSDSELKKDINAVIGRMTEVKEEFAGGSKTLSADCVKAVEQMIDRLGENTDIHESSLEKSHTAAELYFCTAIAKRMERAAVKAGQYNRLQPAALSYINRLCDLTESFARYQESLDMNKKPDKNIQQNDAVSEMPKGEMKNMAGLTLSLAKKLSEVIERKAAADGVKVVVAIVDAGANLILLHATDDAFIASVQIAQDKAYTSAALKMFTHTALELSRGGALDGLNVTAANRLSLLGGGAPLKIGDKIVGGLGVSGGTAQEDTDFAIFGAECMKFLTEQN